jgi:RNA polymerase sigma-70 factor (sigma-E family)
MVARAPCPAEMEPRSPFGRAWRVTEGGWVTGDRDTEELQAFLADRGDDLLRCAVLLAGGREAGEDLLQTAVERLLARWRRFDGDPEGYLRRTMANLATDRYRRHRRWQRKARLLRAQLQPPSDATAEVDLRDALVRILLELPARQRTVLVLRYWEQLDEAETARVLGWPEGTVKSATSRGLRRLRELAATWPETGARPELTEKR